MQMCAQVNALYAHCTRIVRALYAQPVQIREDRSRAPRGESECSERIGPHWIWTANTPANTPTSEDDALGKVIWRLWSSKPNNSIEKPESTDDVYAGWPQIAYLPANVLVVLGSIRTSGLTCDDMRVHDGRIMWTSPKYRALLRRLRMAVARACLGIAEYEYAYGSSDAYRRKPLPARSRDDYASVQLYVLLQLWERLLVSNVSWACFIAVRNDALLRGMYGFVDAIVRCNDKCIREMRRYVNAHGRLAYSDVGDDEIVITDTPVVARDHNCIHRVRGCV